MDWQSGVVLAIEVVAIAYLVHRLVGRRSARRPADRPDVRVEALLRRRRPPPH